jgi:PEP-CTERM motif
MRSKLLLALAAVGLLAFVPVASADALGGSPGTIGFSSAPNAPGYPTTTLSFGSCTTGSCGLGGGYVLLPNADTEDEDILGWSLETTLTTVTTTSIAASGQVVSTAYNVYPTYASGLLGVSMNGATATLNIGDSGGDDVFGTVVWTAAVDDENGDATIIGTFEVTSETLGPTTGPAGILESVFVGQFPNTGITPGSMDTLTLSVGDCTGYAAAGVDCLSSGDPTGEVTGLSIQSQSTSPVPAPEPGTLTLLALGLAVCFFGHKGFSKRVVARA